ncbi:MAG: hypothetical protein M1814_001306 [Vezdaea aestivalis]|nr:MAG: hypothetical protein M1814_001306 [Vezdaea aestivalis]
MDRLAGVQRPLAPVSEVTQVQGNRLHNNGRRNLPISSACTACRSLHLKCSGGLCCERCASKQIACSYQTSRRGKRRPKGSPSPNHFGQSASAYNHEDEWSRNSTPAWFPVETDLWCVDFLDSNLAWPGSEDLTPASRSTALSEPRFDNQSQWLDGYYQFVAASHPFLLPRPQLEVLLQERVGSDLELSLRFIASYHIAPKQALQLRVEVEDAIDESTYPSRDLFRLQSMILFIIGLHAGGIEDTTVMVSCAEELAFELGLDNVEGVSKFSRISPLLGESALRTWWELYCMTGLLAGVHQRKTFRLYGIDAKTILPCEEVLYDQSRIHEQNRRHILADISAVQFSDKSIAFSSFAYRIDAVRILGDVLAVSSSDNTDPNLLRAADASIANWFIQLPSSKREPIDNGGQCDEMLFEANLVINASTIILHKPRSEINADNFSGALLCAPPPKDPFERLRVVHGAKAMQAAFQISELITIPSRLSSHTHLFSCGIILGLVTQLAAAALSPSNRSAVKAQVRLSLAALSELGRTWPLALDKRKQALEGLKHLLEGY